MIDTSSLWIYGWVFFALLAAGMGAPLPEELPIVTAGALVGHASEEPITLADRPDILGVVAVDLAAPFPATLPWAALHDCVQPVPEPKPNRLRWWIMLPLCIFGVVVSDGFLYGIGRLGGPRLLEHRLVKRLLKPEKRQKIEENFHKYGDWVLLFARLLPGIRSPIFITAGMMRLSLARFLLADGIYAIPGVNLLFWLAFWFGDQFRETVERAEKGVARLRPLIILLVIAVVAGLLLSNFLRRPVVTGDPEELPLPLMNEMAAKIEHSHQSGNTPTAPSPDGKTRDSQQPDPAKDRPA